MNEGFLFDTYVSKDLLNMIENADQYRDYITLILSACDDQNTLTVSFE